MELSEVDVKLFITCRLCLEEPGVFPIIPSIKEDIKYCFDIDIEPFDGLPQLICKKCKLTLSEYYAIKNTFLKKQQLLREKCVNQAVYTTQPLSDIVNCKKTDDSKEKEIKSTTPVVPTAQVTPETPPTPGVQQHNSKQVNDLLKKDYDEHFVCKICSKSFLKLAFIKKHLSNSHKKIFNKHKKIFKRSCSVQLNKIDDKVNCTGQSNVVVKNREKIITNRSHSQYHSFYLKKGIRNESESVEKEHKTRPVKRPVILLDSSDDEICSGKKRKSRRLFSCSSTQTTVLEENNACGDTSNKIVDSIPLHDSKAADVVAECINIDDTSSDAPAKEKIESENLMVLQQKRQNKVKIANYKAIQNIVTMCHKKYIKKIEAESAKSNNQKFSESSLKHKVLSLGRKVLHKQGFGCTGLLRYMEHKDLEILWQPTPYANQNKGFDFVRIMPKIKTREVSENDDSGWKDLHEISFCSVLDQSGVVNNSNPSDNKSEALAINAVNEDKSLPPVQEKKVQLDCVLGTNNALNELTTKNKLLNKSPVANPKQLPKKNNVSETKPVTVQENDVGIEVSHLTHESAQLNAEVEDTVMCMPIITATLSLSTANDIDKPSDIVVDKPTPRIKVKPASELMSEQAFKNQDSTEDIWAFNKSNIGLPYHLSSTAVYGAEPECSQADQQPEDASDVGVSGASASDDVLPSAETNSRAARDKHLEFVTLHTLELPNTKTKSPFQYFRTVLLYHGLFLMDLNEELPAHFNCLVRFKLLLKQDTKRPLGVVLSLFCSDNNFCFTFKDSSLTKFDPNQLPAFWQWELLKIYKSDVVDKILQNAEKIGKPTYDNTKNFLCLLKSIDCITES